MVTSGKSLSLKEMEAQRLAQKEAKANKPARVFSDEEKTLRKERVVKAKDALSRSVGIKGEHVAPARAALKSYLQRLNEPKQPDEAQFEMLVEAPFKAPPKKKPGAGRF
ncbi:MAG: hypothetical protein ABIO83_00105 [Ilumatobacteraceae bacterium]